MSERIERIGNSVIVYDDAIVDQVDERLFARTERDQAPRSSDGVAGRGHTLFVDVAGRPCVLRHYYRGGMIRRLSEDAFVWTGEDRTRSFREWRLLAELMRRRLPVPRPVAARYVRSGPRYTADLITERLPGVESLATRLGAGPLPADAWRSVGSMIARFHAEQVFHADLNAHNIQIAAGGAVYLLDFDRGSIRSRDGGWKRGNLQRLRRSLDKIRQYNAAQFADGDWDTLLQGYGAWPAR